MTINCYPEQTAGNSLALFTDVSLNPGRRLGVGACLLVPASFLDSAPDTIERTDVSARLQFERFAETSSTRLEVQTVLWALKYYRAEINRSDSGRVQIYTDSQCVVGLPGRRAGLEANDFVAGRSGRPLINTDLYRAFYAAHDQIGFELIKIKGHSRSGSHNSLQRIFSYVDQQVRGALKLWMGELADQDFHINPATPPSDP
ncbi:MAG: ribonuclease H [Steroidobacteraceae bacterium]|nr:ribonuclease H [Deltaproteobacteria bacterium]